MFSNMKDNQNTSTLISVMLAFFVMGFVDLVGIVTNYVEADFKMSDTSANLLAASTFIWFLVLSVPTGILVSNIGRRKTVLLSLGITTLSLFVPLLDYSVGMMFVSFSLLGIGNTFMQVALNPLLSNIVRQNRIVSALTLGQLIKAIASFLAPIIVAWSALEANEWRTEYAIFMQVAKSSSIGLGVTDIEERNYSETTTYKECFSLLKDKFILMTFFGIICHVGIDVGINLTIPKVFMERLNIPLEEAGLATSTYFIFRTIGCFTGAFILMKTSMRNVFGGSVLCMLAGIIMLCITDSSLYLYSAVALVGIGNSNIFPIIFAEAMHHEEYRKYDISSLMIMGLFGGSVFPFLMGLTSDQTKYQSWALGILLMGICYLIFLCFKLKR